MKTQLLCTFAHRNDLNIVTEYIKSKYEIPERRIFAFANELHPQELYCTYNAETYGDRGANTISIHRKKETNTLYTVNALNTIICAANNGVLDKMFQVDWTLYRNSLLLTNDEGLRRIQLQLMRRINL